MSEVAAITTPLAPPAARRSLLDMSAGPFVLVGAVMAAWTIYVVATVDLWGFDFHGGAWAAARDVWAGRSPYQAPDPAKLLVPGNAYIPPPLFALLCGPLALLSFVPAVVVFGVACTAALVLALRIVGVRDWRVYGLALTSYPFVASLGLGQPDGLLALGIAVAWRYRSSWRGAAALGIVIALKLLAWPLLLWLVLTRRFRQAGVAAAVAAGGILGSWSLIGFQGLAQYRRLLDADATAFAIRSHSVVAAALRLGTTEHAARLIAILVAAAVAGLVVRLGTDRDLALFTAAISFGLLASPIMWTHYVVALYVPLAVAHRRPEAWLLTIPYWLSPLEPPPHVWKVFLVLLLTAALGVLAAEPELRRPRARRRARAGTRTAWLPFGS
jgi:alpha-1,2-mannosyltransferase